MCVESIEDLYLLAHQDEFEEWCKRHPIDGVGVEEDEFTEALLDNIEDDYLPW